MDPSAAPPVAWRGSHALLGASYALPAALVMLADVDTGLALAVGVLPAAIGGLPPTRHARRAIAAMGVVVGGPMAIGAVLGGRPWSAMAVLFGVAIGAVRIASRSPRLGMLAANLGLPMLAIGFSFRDDPSAAFEAAALMVVGSIYAFAVSRLWPEEAAPSARPTDVPTMTLDYGVRLGLAGVTAASVGFALDLDHVGWACGAALLVMRPAVEMQRLRSVGRIASVAVGGAAAVGWVHLEPRAAGYSVIIIAVLASAAATHGSRWYLTSAFTTFLVFTLLLQGAPAEGQDRFNERLSETILGVAIAYLFGLALPRLAARAPRPDSAG